jgi:hypothetical protein
MGFLYNTSMKKKLPIGLATFKDIIGENYLYVDKTKAIFPLVAEGGRYFFLSRPRRFGKSLLISTLKELFSGNKELFKGLWIENQIEWKPYPVLHFDFTKIAYHTPEILQNELSVMLEQRAKESHIHLSKNRPSVGQLEELIRQLAQENKVVILIDEYDKPIIDYIHQPDIAKANRDILRTFYSVIKAMDEHIRFVFLTGVSKFSKVSVFSGLNNLNDITLDNKYSTLLGYTQSELELNFSVWFEHACQNINLTLEKLLDWIRQWYNGYSWDGRNFVYNPFSILNFFEKCQFQNFWFSSGTPTFLVKTMVQNRLPVEQLENYESTPLLLEAWDMDQMNVPSLLFQTGYLTIKKVRDIPGGGLIYNLSYPNREVKEAFLAYMLGAYSHTPAHQSGVTVYHLRQALENNDLEKFMAILKSVYAGIPYNVSAMSGEGHYHAVFYTLLTLLGLQLHCEVQTNQGRIDDIIQTNQTIYILEFKIGKAEQALAQIIKKGYAEPYSSQGKKILLIGIGFDAKKHNIHDWKTTFG